MRRETRPLKPHRRLHLAWLSSRGDTARSVMSTSDCRENSRRSARPSRPRPPVWVRSLRDRRGDGFPRWGDPAPARAGRAASIEACCPLNSLVAERKRVLKDLQGEVPPEGNTDVNRRETGEITAQVAAGTSAPGRFPSACRRTIRSGQESRPWRQKSPQKGVGAIPGARRARSSDRGAATSSSRSPKP